MRAKIADDRIRAHTLSKYPLDITRLHSNGDIYIHDTANGIIPYCSGADFEYLLHSGLWTPQIVSAPPKHFGSALCQLTNYFCISQNEWAGAQAVGDFNTLLAPFVYRDHLTPPQIEQELQRFVFDINQQSRSSFETPFTNIMLNTKTPAHLADKPVIFKGFDGFTYGDFSDEAIAIIRALNRVYMQGDGGGKPFTFPIPTINLIPSTDFSSPMWLELMEAEARFGTYYFMNYIGTEIDPNTIRAMCCHLNLDMSELPPASGRWTMSASTGSIGVVTINLGRLGFRASHGENIYDILDELLHAARDSLLLKDTWIQSMYDSGMLPVTRHYGCNFDRYFRTIGVLGIPEMITNMTGDPAWLHMDIVHDVLTHIRNRTREFQQETGKLFNLECVPGESAAVTLARKDRPLGIFTQGTSDNPYYSNLIIPSNEPMSISEKALLEEDILNLFTGGTVHRIFLMEDVPSPEALAKLIPHFAKSYKIPYFDLCRTFSICPSDKTYYNGVVTTCDCGAKTNVYSRIVGYYRDIFNSNDGRIAEILDRAPSYI